MKRQERNLTQREVAAILDVDLATVHNWERNHTAPYLRAWPAILEFLGYDPRPEGRTAGDKLRRRREGLGLSWKEAAEVMGVDPSTVSKWERRPDYRQNHISIPKIAAFLGRDPLPEPETSGEWLRHSRLLAGLTQKELAKRLGTCQESVSEWETGKREVPGGLLERLEAIAPNRRNGSQTVKSSRSKDRY